MDTHPNALDPKPQRLLKNDLSRARLTRRLSQRQAARILGISRYALSKYERGVASPPLAIALGLEVLYRELLPGLYLRLYHHVAQKIRAAEQRQRASATRDQRREDAVT